MTIDEVWTLITNLEDTLLFIGGGLKSQTTAIGNQTTFLVDTVPRLIESSAEALANGIKGVNSNVDYSRQFVVDKLSAKIDTINASSANGIKALEKTVVDGNKEILQSLKETNDHIDEVFAHLETFTEKIVKGMEDGIKKALEGVLGGLDDAINESTNRITTAIDLQTLTIMGLSTNVKEGFDKLDDAMKRETDKLIEESKASDARMMEFQTRIFDFLVKHQETEDQKMRDKIGDVAGAISLAGLGIAAAIGTGFTALQTTIAGTAAAEKLAWAPIIAALTGGIATITALWKDVIEPMIKDPEKVIAEAIATVTTLYYNVGRRTYDVMKLGEDK